MFDSRTLEMMKWNGMNVDGKMFTWVDLENLRSIILEGRALCGDRGHCKSDSNLSTFSGMNDENQNQTGNELIMRSG